MPIAKSRILFEDQWLLAVDKLGGELTVKGKGKVQKLPLFDFLKIEYPTLVALHRLDFETSGVVVFAKSRKVLETVLATKFAGWRKQYLALVLGVPPRIDGTVEIRLPARSGSGTVAAKTEYHVKEKIGPVSLLEVTIERGQKHQIRRHMAALRHPLILDDIYGDKKANRHIEKFLKFHRFFLHAVSVTFPHPVSGEQTVISAPVPMSFENALRKFREIV